MLINYVTFLLQSELSTSLYQLWLYPCLVGGESIEVYELGLEGDHGHWFELHEGPELWNISIINVPQ